MLEQTDVQSLRFNFAPPSKTAPTVARNYKFNSTQQVPLQRTLCLSTRPLIMPTDDAVPLVDLRPFGAPLAPYACRVHRLVVNGGVVPSMHPIPTHPDHTLTQTI